MIYSIMMSAYIACVTCRKIIGKLNVFALEFVSDLIDTCNSQLVLQVNFWLLVYRIDTWIVRNHDDRIYSYFGIDFSYFVNFV